MKKKKNEFFKTIKESLEEGIELSKNKEFQKMIKLTKNKKWLKKMAKKEDYGCISVGGLLVRFIEEKQNSFCAEYGVSEEKKK